MRKPRNGAGRSISTYMTAHAPHANMPCMPGLSERLAAILAQIEEQWRRLDAPIVNALRPGLDDATMDSVAAAQGWSMPEELRVWYRWHDGAEPTKRRSIGPGGFEFLTLSEALQVTAWNRDFFAGAAPLFWPDQWFVFLRMDAQRLYMDTTRNGFRNGSTPIGLVSREPEDGDVHRAGSLLQAASLWLWLLEGDHYRVEDGGDLVPVDWASLPLWLRLSGLA